MNIRALTGDRAYGLANLLVRCDPIEPVIGRGKGDGQSVREIRVIRSICDSESLIAGVN